MGQALQQKKLDLNISCPATASSEGIRFIAEILRSVFNRTNYERSRMDPGVLNNFLITI